MSEELLPCPFCGSADIGLAKKFVFCQACGAEAGFGDGSPNIAAWNTRPALIDHLEADGGVEAMREALERIAGMRLEQFPDGVDEAYSSAQSIARQALSALPVLGVGR